MTQLHECSLKSTVILPINPKERMMFQLAQLWYWPDLHARKLRNNRKAMIGWLYARMEMYKCPVYSVPLLYTCGQWSELTNLCREVSVGDQTQVAVIQRRNLGLLHLANTANIHIWIRQTCHTPETLGRPCHHHGLEVWGVLDIAMLMSMIHIHWRFLLLSTG